MSAPSKKNPKPLEVFLSFAPDDEERREALVRHLAQLEREGSIRLWHKGMVGPGQEKMDGVEHHLATANIVLLLVSANFIGSDDLYKVDVKRAMERHARREARVVPVVLGECDWQAADFGELEALPPGGRPVLGYKNQDKAFAEIARGVRAIVEGLSISEPEAALPPLPRASSWKRAAAGAALVGLAGLSAFLLLRRAGGDAPDHQSSAGAPPPAEAPTAPVAVPPTVAVTQPPGASSGAGELPAAGGVGAANAAGNASASAPEPAGPKPGQTKVETGDIETGDRSPVRGGNREGGGSTDVSTGKITTGDKSGADIGNIKGSPGGASTTGVKVKTGAIKTGNDSPVTIGNTTDK